MRTLCASESFESRVKGGFQGCDIATLGHIDYFYFLILGFISGAHENEVIRMEVDHLNYS